MIGVCIKYFHENYGGMLQAYATTAQFEKMGIEYELIQYEKVRTPVGIVKSLPRLLNGVLLNDKYEAFCKKQGEKKHPEFKQNNAVRLSAFEQFKKTHFTKLSPIYKGYEELCNGARQYSAVVTGSDQLWSPAGLPTNYYNLKFVPNEIRKISYASSFGVKQIPWYQVGRTREFLNRIEFISMRENRGSEIVKELTGRDVPTVLDPVFMFHAEEWNRMIPKAVIYEKPYIFAYFLGENPEFRKAVKEAADKLHCKIITLRHLDQYIPADESFGDYAPYDVGPDKFLNLLRGASYVCTDSFHGSCFSIIFHKQFVTFNRYAEGSKHSKNSRIDTLCGNLGLQSRRYERNTKLEEQLCAPIDFQTVDSKLEEMRVVAENYLTKAFDGIS